MPFQNLLEDLLERMPGSLGAILVDWEGEAVAQSGVMNEYDLKVFGAHKGIILNNLREVVERTDESGLEEITITTTSNKTLVLPVTTEYFLVITLQREATLGRSLFEARRTIAALKEEIA